MVLSNGVEYSFDVTVSTLSQPQKFQFAVRATWLSEAWTTSFSEDELGDACPEVAEYLVGSECTLEDKSKVSSLFFSIRDMVKRKQSEALEKRHEESN